jgi:hypothetical protein
MRTGEWPTCADLQRELDRLNIPDDVAQANNEMPRLPGQSVPQHDDHFRLPLHILAGMEAADGLMLICRQIIWRAISLYHSDVGAPRLANDDPQLSHEHAQDLLRRAFDVLRGSPPHPLGSGHSGSNGWSYEVDGQVARHLRNIQSIDDYIAWQIKTLRPAAVPARRWLRKPIDKERRNAHLLGLYGIAAAIIGALIGGYFLVTHEGNSSQNPPLTSSSNRTSSSSPPSSSSSAFSGLDVDQSWLTAQNFCSWRRGTNHVPVLTSQPLQLRIDDRCNFPQHPDPQTDTPTRIFASPSQESVQVGAIPDGTLITVRCYITGGEVVKDAEKNASDIWLRITTPAGLIPNVNTGGGFTEQQLVSLGIGKC